MFGLNKICEFNLKSDYIRRCVTNRDWFDWDYTIAVIPILSSLIAVVLILLNCDFFSIIFDTNLPFSISWYILTIFVTMIFFCPPFIFVLWLRKSITRFRRKFFNLNTNPWVFTRRNISILTAIILPCIFFIFVSIDIFPKNILFLCINTLINSMLPFSDNLLLVNMYSVFTVIVFLFMHFVVYVIFVSFYKIYDKNYRGSKYNTVWRTLSRSYILWWLTPFVISIFLCFFIVVVI